MKVNTITISRKQVVGEPVEAFASQAEVGARMEAADFINAVADEMELPVWVSRAKIKRALVAASEKVFLQMKLTTQFVKSPPKGALEEEG